jgi:hypothetical protein
MAANGASASALPKTLRETELTPDRMLNFLASVR